MKKTLICLAAGAIAGAAILIIVQDNLERSEEHSVANGNFHAACINVIRDADAKRVRIFATATSASESTNIAGWSIDVVNHPDIIESHSPFLGTYPAHHNALVLNLAAVQILNRNRAVGFHLIRTLNQVCPDKIWSSPGKHNLSIQEILKGIETDDANMKEFLLDEKLQWTFRSKEYGVPNTNLEPISGSQ